MGSRVPRVLTATEGAILKFVVDAPYQLKVRSGFKTTIIATSGAVASYRGDLRSGDCVRRLEFNAPSASISYANV